MNAQKLSERLAAVASFVPTGSTVADIGSDHAYLPCYLIHQKIATHAIAGEVVKGPYESARSQVQQEGLTNQVTVRLADGLQAITPEDQVDTITIAGMGGPLIASILAKTPSALTNVTRLILQPNIHARAIREWAMHNGFAILDEMIMEEDDKIYEVIVLQRGEMTLTEKQLLFGPLLSERKAPAFIKKWQGELAQWHKILEAIAQAENTTAMIEKRKELQYKIEMAEAILS
ncbi:SAM-dependent methyltransferase [Lysinibacillus alkalisoli]|uniref:SAM-dependent methyltransferase n=1 Tax=Lysinibacillus alkalisoli TaxID=1911548 RepID=A0A917D5N8_9BACI|nr:tRNA (adenine(22)-N(1))-methyltransferase TrmK [Lysinibacillus alkalisoli]GGG13780.1 SAM-dependent methyltransferase [Lysinibacillus alkalisoli]